MAVVMKMKRSSAYEYIPLWYCIDSYLDDDDVVK